MTEGSVAEAWQGMCVDDGTGKNIIYVNHLGQVCPNKCECLLNYQFLHREPE